MNKDLRKVMKVNGFILKRAKNHLVWEHETGVLITTSASPKDKGRYLANVKRDIKHHIGHVI